MLLSSSLATDAGEHWFRMAGLAENGCEEHEQGEKMCPQMRILGVEIFSSVSDFSQMIDLVTCWENEN